MPLLHRASRFFGPWLTFAALNGLGSGIISGLIVSVIGLVVGLCTLIGGVAGGQTWKTVQSIGVNFPAYGFIVLTCTAYGVAAGIYTGLITALVGGNAGKCWSFLSCIGAVSFASSYSTEPRGCCPDLSVMALLMTVSLVGAAFPIDFITRESTQNGWDASLRGWMRRSWLPDPPQAARMVGIALPILGCFLIDSYFTLPIYLKNQSYIPNYGVLMTWENSRRMTGRGEYSSQIRCQSNLRQIMMGVMQYTQDYNDLYPPRPVSPQNGAAVALFPYIRDPSVFQCPRDFNPGDSHDPKNGDYTDYWFNARLYGFNLNGLTNPSHTVIYGEGNTGAGEANASYALRSIPLNFPPGRRHFNRAPYAFADGHVKLMGSGVVSNTAPASSPWFTMNP